MAIEITKENFEQVVLGSDKPVLVDFWASWCGPCKMMSPVIDQLAEELAGKVTVGKINVDEQQELAVRYGVMSIPTVVLFRGGKEDKRSVGFVPKVKLLASLGL
ncbi:MAG TPA: thioredoxin [Candidatus Pygmaiobacter gallistercoris]|nr:thioredoxin [Candidatus Pygmaiobacter gallistercoris]